MNIFLVKRCYFFLVSIILFSTVCFADISRDLELDKIFVSINRTHTIEGKKALQALLANPIADLQVLSHRQSVIAHFLSGKQLCERITAELKNFAQYEASFNTACNAQTNSVEQDLLQRFYFSSERFKAWNESPIGLELGQLAHVANLCSSSIQHFLTMVVFNWGLGEKDACCPTPDSHDHKHHKHKKHGHKHNHDHANKGTLAYMRQFLMAWHGIAQIQELYSLYTIICNETHIIKTLQKQLMTVARGMRSVKQIHLLLEEKPEIISCLPSYKKLDDICMHVGVSKKLDTLLTLLEARTFKGDPSVFSRIGNILAAYKLLQEVSDELQPALQAIGEIDAYISCAHLLADQHGQHLHYSFAHYVTEQTTPYIDTHNFWHPLVNASDVIVNSIQLGNNGHVRNVLLTGPNASGKSTNLKSVTLCVYLAQTLSIVPAQRHTQTLFKEIYSSVVIVDQLQEGKSLFVTELENAQALVQRVVALKDGEYMFVVLDELFKSTQHEKGQHVAEQLLKVLYASPRVMTITTTHFEKLIDFALKNSLVCTNYTVQDFRLIPGIGRYDCRSIDNYFC